MRYKVIYLKSLNKFLNYLRNLGSYLPSVWHGPQRKEKEIVDFPLKFDGPIVPKKYIELTKKEFDFRVRTDEFGVPNVPGLEGERMYIIFDSSQKAITRVNNIDCKTITGIFWDKARNLGIRIVDLQGTSLRTQWVPTGYRQDHYFDVSFFPYLYEYTRLKFSNYNDYVTKFLEKNPGMKVALQQYQDTFEKMGEPAAIEYVKEELGGPGLTNMDQLLEWVRDVLIVNHNVFVTEKFQIIVGFRLIDAGSGPNFVISSIKIHVLSEWVWQGWNILLSH